MKNLFPSFFKECQICHKDLFMSRHRMCNKCLNTVVDIIEQNIRYGTEIKSGNPEMDLFCRLTLVARRSESKT